MMRNTQREVVYRVDPHDALVFFNESWNHFADENGSSHLFGEKIALKPIWGFIHDAETRHIHESLLEKVRRNASIRKLPFRCDAPDQRRYMEMDILPAAGDTVEYRCRILKTEMREPVAVLSNEGRDAACCLRMCSWCKKVDAGNESWVEVEDGIKALDLFSRRTLPMISHTICAACMRELEGVG